MNRSKESKPAELLAPAGSMSALEAVLKAGADAVYLSGKKFGMRGHRSSFHFTDWAMKQAVEKVHEKGARIYVTVNNLLADEELEDALAYIDYLAGLGADAVILQDLGLLRKLAANPLDLDIHVSTMMNVHSTPFADFLKARGVSRIITSRDITLAQAAEIARRSGVEVEYFVHGDMCSVQSGLCHLSGVLHGQSANRGRCLKPCRWPWKMVNQGKGGAPRYLLARNDMCLIHALPEVLESGISSLKIEGRMRPAEFLEEVVGVYRRAMDRYYENPFAYREDGADIRRLFAKRTRDFTSSHAFGDPGPDSMGKSGKREPRFFSHAQPEPGLDPDSVEADAVTGAAPLAQPSLCAAVSHAAALDALVPLKPDWIHLHTYFYPGMDPDILSALVEKCRAKGVRSAVALPPVTVDRALGHLPRFIESLEPGPDAWIAGNAGQLTVIRDSTDAAIMAGPLFNIFNTEGLGLLAEAGVVRAALSPELSLDHLASMKRPFPLEVEFAVQGPVQAMYTEDCLLRLSLDKHFDPGACRHFCEKGGFSLENQAGEQYPVKVTRDCSNAVFFPRHLCMLHRLAPILEAGIASLRLDFFQSGPEEAAALFTLYRKALDRLLARDPAWFNKEALGQVERLCGAKLWEGGTRFGVLPVNQCATHEKE